MKGQHTTEQFYRVPEGCGLLLAGLPAAGKSTFGYFLSATADFAHYDMEKDPQGWPCPATRVLWDQGPQPFLEKVRVIHRRFVLDWGFPVGCEQVVQALRNSGVRLVWFTGDKAAARAAFIRRSGPEAVAAFDRQVRAIEAARFPDRLSCDVVVGIDARGFTAPDVIARDLFKL